MNKPGEVGRSSSLAAIVLTGCLLAGCGATPSHEAASGRVSATAAAAGEIEVTAVDREGYESVIADRRGQVVLVDFWATWCLPCVEQLPHTLELAERNKARGLAVVTVSCDEPAETERVAEFLRAKHASGATHLISRYGGSPRTMEEFEIASGAVPFYKLYDRAGRLRQTFGIDPRAKKQFTPAEIDAAIDQLLAE